MNENTSLLRGVVVKNVGSSYSVLYQDAVYECRLRGKVRLSMNKNTNPIAVGDWVLFSADAEKGNTIHNIEPRRNCILRRAVKLSAQRQIIAANIDLALLVYTAHYPPTPLEFVDRFLLTACAYGVPTILLCNKCDLQEELAASQNLAIEQIYRPAQIEILYTSTTTQQGIEELRKRIMGKTVLIAGQSGVGKSSLMNSLEPTLQTKTAPLSEQHGLGVHTTTFSEMFALTSLPNTYIIDTPGIKGFGVTDLEKHEIAHYFPEIFTLATQCKFANCLHDTEPGCSVRQAFETGILAESRYASYLSILYEEEENYR